MINAFKGGGEGGIKSIQKDKNGRNGNAFYFKK